MAGSLGDRGGIASEPWPVLVSAIAGGVSVAAGLSSIVSALLGSPIPLVFLVIGGLAALVAAGTGAYAVEVLGASVSPTGTMLALGAIAVGLAHLGGLLLWFLLLWLLAPFQFGPWECGGCQVGPCCQPPDPCPCCEGSSSGSSEGCGSCGGGCGDGCGLGCEGSDSSTTGDGGDPGGGTGGCGCIVFPGLLGSVLVGSRPGSLPEGLRNRWAHHPDHPDFDEDVFEVAGLRVCIGCALTFPLFLAAALLLTVTAPPVAWWVWILGGLGLASLQALSAAGWTQTKARKVLVKTGLGLGTAGLLHGVRLAPWPSPLQALVLFAALALALASTIPRSRRMADWRAQAG